MKLISQEENKNRHIYSTYSTVPKNIIFDIQEYVNLVRYLEKEFLQLVEAHKSGTVAMVSIVAVRNGKNDTLE